MVTNVIPGIERAILRLSQVESVTGFKKSKIYQMIKEGAFPAPVKMGPKSSGWYSDLVQNWINDLATTGGNEAQSYKN